MLLKFTFLQGFASITAVGAQLCYLSLVITLIAVACSQFDKLKTAILDIRQQNITPHNRQEAQNNHTGENCELQVKLNACIRHHQNIIE
jgi:hypothetical protein